MDRGGLRRRPAHEEEHQDQGGQESQDRGQDGSAPQIEQLAALLKQNPRLEVLIVGHTDGQGAFDYNLSLSQRRAQAVVDTLVSGHAIERKRLTPAGAGMVAPVATNRTDEGRAKNRRVEIVERIVGR